MGLLSIWFGININQYLRDFQEKEISYLVTMGFFWIIEEGKIISTIVYIIMRYFIFVV